MPANPFFTRLKFRIVMPLLQGVFVLLCTPILISHAVDQTRVVPPAGLVSWGPGDVDARDTQDATDGVLTNGALADTARKVSAALSLNGIDAATEPKPVKAYSKLPLSFEANQGQTDAQVEFLSRGRGYTLFLTADEAVLVLHKPTDPKTESEKDPSFTNAHREDTSVSVSDVLRMRLIGSTPAPQVVGLEQLPGKVNYLTGNDQTKWRTNIATYAKVKYERVYDGVDLVYYGNQRQLEYDFVVAPGTDPGAIRLELEGAKRIEVDTRGDLVLHLPDGQVRFNKPYVYQTVAGVRQEIAGAYVLQGKHQVGFQVADYDAGRPLIIDPILVYSTYLGGNSTDIGRSIAVDEFGNAYVAGETSSTTFPTAAPGTPFDSTRGGTTDAFVTKLNAAGSALVYSTYLGGSVGSNYDHLARDFGNGIAVDSSGNAYITGETRSSDFPTTPAPGTPFQAALLGFSDVFVTKLNAAGDGLIYSTYLGGDPTEFTAGGFSGQCTGSDIGIDIAVDQFGNAYVTGTTTSIMMAGNNFVLPAAGFPTTPGAFQLNNAGSSCNTDAFVTKLNATGSALLYSTYLGGSSFTNTNSLAGKDDVHAIALDPSGNAYVTGTTNSLAFPTTSGSLQPTRPGGIQDAFVTKLNTSGSALVYSTYLGGSANVETGRGIAVDAFGNAVVVGSTFSTNFPGTQFSPIAAAVPPIQPQIATNRDGFLAKLNPSGSALLYSTYFGGGGFDEALDVTLDSSGNAYVTGITRAISVPPENVPRPWQVNADCGLGGGDDAFVTKVNAAGTAFVYSTFLGGASQDQGLGIAVDPTGKAYVTGFTASSNFPTENPLQPVIASSVDAFVANLPTVGCAETALPDADDDGVLDVDDNCPDAPNPDQTDSDMDGIGDACDDDNDNDGVLNVDDNCPLVANFDQSDLDGDGIGDVCDGDLDGDGVDNDVDNCPAAINPNQTDTDGDSLGDACDLDDDNDGLEDSVDNCPRVVNPEQDDLDSDGIGDFCDADLDGDGVDNIVDNCPIDPNTGQDDTDTDGLGDTCDDDADNDSILNVEDNCPLVANFDQLDLDGDGIGDACEDDLDGDGVDDDVDNCPITANSAQSDFDGDGIGDLCDPDTDEDGVSNDNDLCAATPVGVLVDPTNGCSVDQLCPCDGPRGTTMLWRNHGKYISCTARATNELLAQGLITEAEKGAIISAAAGSTCGNKQ